MLWVAGAAIAAITIVVVMRGVDAEALHRAWRAATARPLVVVGVATVYTGAFVLRALAWRRVLPSLPLGHALAAIHVALAGNHLLPARLGEPLRVASAVRRAGVPVDAAVASTVTLRAVDAVALVGLALVLAPGTVARLPGSTAIAVAAVLAAGIAVGGGVWLRRRAARPDAGVATPDVWVVAAAVTAWAVEAVVVWQAAQWAGVALTASEALLVSVVAVLGQVAAIAPGGVGTYEAAGTAGLAALGVEPATALAVIVAAHALKTVYALAAGGVGLLMPAPGIADRVRLPRHRPGAQPPSPPAASAPVVLFLPAHDEAATVADVVARVPGWVSDHPVWCVVVDDGSRDDTAARAEAAGARVLRRERNDGLGAAVRDGLALAATFQPAAVAFCDADGEYAPEELARVVAPILAGQAHYVVGSRFCGDIAHMRLHRRWGNLALTRALAVVARQRVTDGQSGYRAVSRAAAGAAEIAHDYNYAQVLTLDLLAKGYGYTEVPISYRWRTQGQSFVRLGSYVTAVVPAVWHLLGRVAAHQPTPAGAGTTPAWPPTASDGAG